MTVNDDRPGTNSSPADPLAAEQRAFVERARVLADAGDAGLGSLAVLTGSTGQSAAMVYTAGFGAARVALRDLLDIVDELAGRSSADDDQDDDGTQPYCSTCGEWIGHFLGMDGWHHFRGDPSPGGDRQLYAADHDAVPAVCVPPGLPLSPAGLATVRQALADAAAWRTWREAGDRDADTTQAARYEALLRRVVTGEAGQ